MLNFKDNEIRKAIEMLCNELNRKQIEQNVYIIIVGAASLILKFNLRRATSDIDILETLSANRSLFGGLGQLLSHMGFHMVSEVMLNLHPDYLDRLELYTQKERIRAHIAPIRFGNIQNRKGIWQGHGGHCLFRSVVAY